MKITPIEAMVGSDPFSIIPPNVPNSPVRIDHLKAGTSTRYYHKYSSEIIIVLKGEVTINGDTIPPASVVSNHAGTIIDIAANSDAFVCRAHTPLLHRSDLAKPPTFARAEEMMSGPLVSVIITTYNVEAYIGAAILSILSQNYRNIEIVVYDDVSNDKTVEIVEQLSSLDHRIKFVQGQKNLGGALAKRAGLIAATGEFFIYCDGDDMVEPNMIKQCVAAVTDAKADCVVFGFDHFSEDRGDFYGEVLPLTGTKLDYVNVIDNKSDVRLAFSFCKLSHISPICFMRSDDHKTAFADSLLDMPFYYDIPTFFAMLSTAKRVAIVNSTFYHYRIGRSGQSVEGWALHGRGMKMGALTRAFEHSMSAEWGQSHFARSLMLHKAVRMAFIELRDMMRNGRHEEYILTIKAFQNLIRRFSIAEMNDLLRKPRFAALAFTLRWAKPGIVNRLLRRLP